MMTWLKLIISHWKELLLILPVFALLMGVGHGNMPASVANPSAAIATNEAEEPVETKKDSSIVLPQPSSPQTPSTPGEVTPRPTSSAPTAAPTIAPTAALTPVPTVAPTPEPEPEPEPEPGLLYPGYPADYPVRYIEGYVDEPGYIGLRFGFLSREAANAWAYANWDDYDEYAYITIDSELLNDGSYGVLVVWYK